MIEDKQVLKEASAWVERMSLPVMDTAQSTAFDAWMAADQRHADAFARLLALWDGKDIETALTISSADGEAAMRRVAQSSPRWRRYLAVAASLILVMGAALTFTRAFDVRSYHMGKGQTDHITLADGTTVDLAPDTDLSVQILPWKRTVKLSKGEAFLDIHHENWRSFTVESEAGSARVLGTAFDIDLQGKTQLAIQVYRGAVSFRADGIAETKVHAGLMGRLEKGRFYLSHFNADHTQPAWLDGWFDADNSALDTVIAKADRYTDQAIHLSDNTDLRRRVSGRFKVADRAAFLTALKYGYGVEAR